MAANNNSDTIRDTLSLNDIQEEIRRLESAFDTRQKELKKLYDKRAELEKKASTKEEKDRLKSLTKEINFEAKKRKEIQDDLFKQRQDEINKLAEQEATFQEARDKQAQLDIDREQAKLNGLAELFKSDFNAISSGNWESLSVSLQQVAAEFALKLREGLKTELDRVLKDFINSQEKMAYRMRGLNNNTGLSAYRDMVQDFNWSMAGSTIVKQERAYKNLSELVDEGILYNVRQRAFLETLSEDMGMIFNASNGSLTRLINLQRQDLSSNRFAIEASLKEFLNQNYETSQYIKHGFEQVSESLLQAQSLMTVNEASKLEVVVQQWLGSLSSVGMSDDSVRKIAAAIGELGSGNINRLQGSAMQNLIVMGAAKQGLSYGEMLNNGISGEDVNTLMRGITDYIAEMGDNVSNVVKSEYARIFGIEVADIIAARQVGNAPDAETGLISDDVHDILHQIGQLIPFTSRVENILSNLQYNWAVGVANDPVEYALYKTTELITKITEPFVSGLGISTKILGTGVDIDLSKILNVAPLLATLPSLLNTGISSVMNQISNLGNTLMGGSEAERLFSRLANTNINSFGDSIVNAQYIRAYGNLSSYERTSGVQTSGSLIVATDDTKDIVKNAKNSATDFANEALIDQDTEYYDTTDIYKLMVEVREEYNTNTSVIIQNLSSTLTAIDGNEGTNSILRSMGESIAFNFNSVIELVKALPTYVWPTMSKIHPEANVVTIGNNLGNLQDLMTLSAMNLQGIYDLLYVMLVDRNASPNNMKDIENQWSGFNDRESLSWAFGQFAQEGPGQS